MEKRIKNMGRGNGSIIKLNPSTFIWRKQIDGKRTNITIKNESGVKVRTKEEAIKVVEKQLEHITVLNNLKTEQELLLKIGQVKKLITNYGFKLTDIFERFESSSCRNDIEASTMRNYRSAYNLFIEYMGSYYPDIVMVDELTQEHAEAFMSHYYKTGISNRTYNLRLFSLKLIFKTLMEDNSIFKHLKNKRNETLKRQAFSVAQLNAIYRKLENPEYYMLHKTEMKTLIFIGLYTGLRLGDGALLLWSSVNWQNNCIEITPKKTRNSSGLKVSIPIFEPFKIELLKHRNNNSEFVLPNVAKRYSSQAYPQLTKDIVKLINASGVGKQQCNNSQRKNKSNQYTYHSLRHTFVSIAMNAGISPEIIRQMTGHTKLEMTSHYAHISNEAKINALECFPVLGASPTQPNNTKSREAMLLELIAKKAPELLSDIK